MIRDCTKCEHYNYELDMKMWGHPCDVFGGCLKEIGDSQNCTTCKHFTLTKSGWQYQLRCRLHGGFKPKCKEYQEASGRGRAINHIRLSE